MVKNTYTKLTSLPRNIRKKECPISIYPFDSRIQDTVHVLRAQAFYAFNVTDFTLTFQQKYQIMRPVISIYY